MHLISLIVESRPRPKATCHLVAFVSSDFQRLQHRSVHVTVEHDIQALEYVFRQSGELSFVGQGNQSSGRAVFVKQAGKLFFILK